MKALRNIFAALLLVGCATQTAIGPKNLTQEFTDEKIVAGSTTKEDVRQLLGKPGSILKSSSPYMAPETWTYSRVDRYNQFGLNYSVLGPTMYGPRGNETRILQITFTNGIVSGKTFTGFQYGDTPDTNPKLKQQLERSRTNSVARTKASR